MVVDVHQYLGPRGGRQITSEAVHAHARACGVDRILVANAPPSSAGQEPDETEANVACLEACSVERALLPLYRARPGSFDSHVPALAGALDSEPFVGAVISPEVQGADADAVTELLALYVAVLSRRRIPALFDMGAEPALALEHVEGIARRHPRLAFILCRAGGGRSWMAALDAVQRAARRGDARLYLNTAGTPVDEVAEAVRTAGGTRLVFGSGAVLLEDAHAQQCRATLERLHERLMPAQFEQLVSGNACELFAIRAA